MSEPVPVIVVTLPARSVVEARSELLEARVGGADLAEIRFDRWPESERRNAAGLFPSPLPLVATLRSRSEGGEGPDGSAQRRELLLALAGLPFRWIDLEAARDLPLLPLLPPSERLGRIVSTHFTTPPTPDQWDRSLRENVGDTAVRKVIAPASLRALLLELLPRLPPSGEAALVAHTTGPSGPLLRAWAGRLRFPLVYAALPERAEPEVARPPVEASQLPVDRLRPFLASPAAPLFAIVGQPVAHSLSPAIHARWMQAEGRSGLYVALDCGSDEEFVEVLRPLAAAGFRGLNITHPLKEVALGAASRLGRGADACGVANCLTLRGDEVEAENTDLAAILRRIEELRSQGLWDGTELGVIGAGGAARATLAAARVLGATARIYARNASRAELLAREFGASAGDPASDRPPSLLVQATDVGRSTAGDLDVSLAKVLGPRTHLLDWVYAAERPTVREAADRAGATYEDGRRLLVYQAAASYGIWWGEEPDPDRVGNALREVGCTP